MPRQEHPQFSEDSPAVISPRNLAIPLWAVIPMVGMFISVTVYFVNTLNSINTKLDAAASDRWRLSYQRQWKYEAERLNANLRLPDPDEIAHKFQ